MSAAHCALKVNAIAAIAEGSETSGPARTAPISGKPSVVSLKNPVQAASPWHRLQGRASGACFSSTAVFRGSRRSRSSASRISSSSPSEDNSSVVGRAHVG